jgi:hypothetical protein
LIENQQGTYNKDHPKQQVLKICLHDNVSCALIKLGNNHKVIWQSGLDFRLIHTSKGRPWGNFQFDKSLELLSIIPTIV